MLTDILETFNTRKFLYPLLGNLPSVDAFPIAGKEERERERMRKGKKNTVTFTKEPPS